MAANKSGNSVANANAVAGIYGGTFDPPHAGHYAAAAAFCEAVGLSALYVIPAAVPPHKTPARADGAARLRMCELAFAGLPAAVVSGVELERGGRSYTADTLGHFAAPGRKLALFCGCDMLLTLDTWHRAAEIFSLADIYFMRRYTGGRFDGERTRAIAAKIAEYEEKFAARISEIQTPPVTVSSTELREKLAAGGDCGTLLHPDVARFIKENGLYRS